MNNLLSRKMTEQAGTETKKTMAQVVDSAYNYQKNGKAYKITFLEFGATGCIACKRMETVMEQTRKAYPESVQVFFINALRPENQDLIKYYGITSIPVQVLLDESGKEFYSHTGYISFDDLKAEFNFE